MSLTQRIIAQLLTVTLVVLTVYSLIELRKQSLLLEATLHAEQEAQFQKAMSGVSTALYEINNGAIKSILDPFLQDPKLIRVTVFDDQGQKVESLGAHAAYNGALPPVKREGFGPTPVAVRHDLGGDIHKLVLPIVHRRGDGSASDAAFVGELQVEYSSRSVRDQVLKSFKSFLIWTALFSIIKVVLMTIFTIRSVVRPVKKLAHASALVGSGKFVVLPESSGNDEISQLTRSFNIMVGDLLENKHFLESTREESLKILGERNIKNLAEQIAQSLSKIGGSAVSTTLYLSVQAFKDLEDMPDDQPGGPPPLWFRWERDGTPVFCHSIPPPHTYAYLLPLSFSGNTETPKSGAAWLDTPPSTAVAHLICQSFSAQNMPKIEKAAKALELSVATALQNLASQSREQHQVLLTHELEAAREIQQAIFTPPIPLEEIQMVSYYLSAARTGGDFYCFHFDAPRRTCYFFVGDVTGHGLGSALVTAMAAGALTAAFSLLEELPQKSTAERLMFMADCVNQSLYQNGNRAGKLMTMAFVGVHIDTGLMHYLNAGHPGVFYAKYDRAQAIKLNNLGTRLGFSAKAQFKVLKLQLSPQDILFLYTDGVTESPIQDSGYLKSPRIPGNDRYQSNLKKISEILTSETRDLESISERIQNLIKDTWGNKPPEDDLTYVAVKWSGPSVLHPAKPLAQPA